MCNVSPAHGLIYMGQEIDAAIVAGGYSYRPELSALMIEICAD